MLTPLSRQVLSQFRVILNALRQHGHGPEKAGGPPGAQLWMMAQVRERPGLRVSDLADVLGIHLSTASNLLDKIEAAGYLRRERSRQDQRVVEIYLTDAGKSALEETPPSRAAQLPEALERLPMKVLRRLDADLQALIDSIHSAGDTENETPASGRTSRHHGG